MSQIGTELSEATAGAVERAGRAVVRVEAGRHSAQIAWCLTPKVVRALYDATASSSRPKTSRSRRCGSLPSLRIP